MVINYVKVIHRKTYLVRVRILQGIRVLLGEKRRKEEGKEEEEEKTTLV